MRLAHLADLHLGFRQFHRLTPRGLNQREADVAMAFSRAVDGVVAAQPDAVVIAGDLFHSVRPTNSAILHAVREFGRLRRALPDAPIVAIGGNHDTPRSSDTVSLFGLLQDIGLHVALEEPRRFEFPALRLSVLAIPHAALVQAPRPAMEPSGNFTHQVLVLHGETPGLFGADRTMAEAGGALLTEADFGAGPWSHVALGHYHVQHQVRERVWYAGALEYVSPNPWGELREERQHRLGGKGWLLIDLDAGTLERHLIEAPRRVLDLPWLDATGLSSSELDRLLADAVSGVTGGIEGAVVRQVIRNVPRPVARELDHGRIREWKASALQFQLDLRRPEVTGKRVGSGAPGHRLTLPEVVEQYLRERPLPASIDRDDFVQTGLQLFHATGAQGSEA